MKSNRGNAGFTLIEVIVALGVALIGFYGIMVLTQNSMNAQSSVSANAAVQDYISLVEMQMVNTPTTCNNVLVSAGNMISPVSGGQTTLNLAFASLPPQPQGATLNATATLTNFTTPVNPQTNWTAQLALKFQKVGSASVGGSTVVRNLPLTITTAPWAAGAAPLVITSCSVGSPPISVSGFQCADFTSIANYNTSVSCNAAFPNALRGGCYNTGCVDGAGYGDNWLARNELVGNTQFCMEGGQHIGECVGGGQFTVQARITCCK